MATSRVPGPLKASRRGVAPHLDPAPHTHTAGAATTRASATGIITGGALPVLSVIEKALHPFFSRAIPLSRELVMRINAAMLLPAPNPAAPQISSADYQDVASDLGIEMAVIQAVAEIEAGSGKKGFDQKGRPIILFEGYWFHKFTGGQFDSHYPHLSSPTWQAAKKYYNRDQWERMYEAMMLDHISAWKAASWGLFQVMGFNHSGSATISSFVKAMFTSEGEHLRSFAAYCKDTDLITALKNKDWAAFARGYNGAGYKQNQYDTKMEQAYKKYVKAAAKAAGAQQK